MKVPVSIYSIHTQSSTDGACSLRIAVPLMLTRKEHADTIPVALRSELHSKVIGLAYALPDLFQHWGRVLFPALIA